MHGGVTLSYHRQGSFLPGFLELVEYNFHNTFLENIIFTVGRLIGDSEFGPDEHRGATVYKCDGRANHPWPSPVCSDDDMTVMF